MPQKTLTYDAGGSFDVKLHRVCQHCIAARFNNFLAEFSPDLRTEVVQYFQPAVVG